MFFPMGIDPEAYQRVVHGTNYTNTQSVKLQKRMNELQTLMRDYIENLANHPTISLSGMMYYGNLNSEFLKLKKEYDSINVGNDSNTEPMKLRSHAKTQSNTKPNAKTNAKPILNENTRQLRKRTKVNYKV